MGSSVALFDRSSFPIGGFIGINAGHKARLGSVDLASANLVRAPTAKHVIGRNP